MHLICWLYKSKCTQKGLAPVYLRITIAGTRAEISTGISIAPIHCHSKKGLLKGFFKSALDSNTKLQQLKDKAIDIYTKFSTKGWPVPLNLSKAIYWELKRKM
jgi:hypothetical protein